MTAQVAAVDGRHVRGRQHGQIGRVVPVQKVAAFARQVRERRQRLLAAREHFGRVDPAESSRARNTEQIQTDVRRRRPIRDHRVRHDLHVVRRQMMCLAIHVLLEQTPAVARYAAQVVPVGLRDHVVVAIPARPADPPGPQRGSGPHRTQHDGEQPLAACRPEMCAPSSAAATSVNAHVMARNPREIAVRGGLRSGRRRPLEQSSMTHQRSDRAPARWHPAATSPVAAAARRSTVRRRRRVRRRRIA